jgi:hypothetical protein
MCDHQGFKWIVYCRFMKLYRTCGGRSNIRSYGAKGGISVSTTYWLQWFHHTFRLHGSCWNHESGDLQLVHQSMMRVSFSGKILKLSPLNTVIGKQIRWHTN